jgi:pimeloyl-ACP methyl ester carboxylesterase
LYSMIMPEFQPTEIWTPSSDDFEYGEAVEKARHAINQKRPEQVIAEVQESVETANNGVVLALPKGDNPDEYSNTEGILLLNSFANPASPLRLVHAEFMRLAAVHHDIHDSDGKLIPVIMAASPGERNDPLATSLPLSSEEKTDIKQGEFAPYAKEVLQAVSEKGIGKISIWGFSYGADIALSASQHAYLANLDVNASAVGDPVGVKDRNTLRLGFNFLQSGSLDSVVAAGNMPVQKMASEITGDTLKDYLDWAVHAAALNPLNRDILRGLGKSTFENKVQHILLAGRTTKLVVGYGGKSSIAKPKVVEPALRRLHNMDINSSLTSIRVEGVRHSWSDHFMLLGKFYLKLFE